MREVAGDLTRRSRRRKSAGQSNHDRALAAQTIGEFHGRRPRRFVVVRDDGGELVSDVHHRECRCVCTTTSHEVTSGALDTRIRWLRCVATAATRLDMVDMYATSRRENVGKHARATSLGVAARRRVGVGTNDVKYETTRWSGLWSNGYNRRLLVRENVLKTQGPLRFVLDEMLVSRLL